MSRVFISGSSGFIGTALLAALAESDHQISSISRSVVLPQGLQASLSDSVLVQQYLQQHQPEIAILLAWQGLPDYSLSVCLENISQQITLIQQLIEVGCRRIILAGSCWQYGAQEGAVSELTMPNNPGVFGSAKNSVLQLAQAICLPAKVELAEARIFYCYGPGQRLQSLLPGIVDKILHGLPLQIRTPYAAVDFVHVTDVVQGLLCLLNAPSVNGVYNVGTGQAQTVAKVVNLALEGMLQPHMYQSMTASESWWGDTSKITKLGYQPKITLADGITSYLSLLQRQN